jgi:hypothetical protein
MNPLTDKLAQALREAAAALDSVAQAGSLQLESLLGAKTALAEYDAQQAGPAAEAIEAPKELPGYNMESQNQQCFVLVGAPFEEQTAYGPFNGFDMASDFSDTVRNEYTWITTLHPPIEAMGTPEQRQPLIDHIIDDWTESLATDDESRLTLLRNGWKGTDYMTLAELRKDAEDAGYEEDEE